MLLFSVAWLLNPLLCVPVVEPGDVTTGLRWLGCLLVVAVLPDPEPVADCLTVEPVRTPGAVLVTVAVLPDDGLAVTEAGFFAAAVCLSRTADDVLVIPLLPAAGRDVTAVPEVAVVLFTGRLLTELPPLSGLLPANTLSDPVL